MSFLDSLKNFITETEADVQKVVAALVADAEVIESDLNSAFHWVISNAPTIAADITEVASFATQAGITANPAFAAAVAAANLAVQGLNAAVTANKAGQNTAQSVLAGYVAIQQARSSVASANAAVAQTAVAPTT